MKIGSTISNTRGDDEMIYFNGENVEIKTFPNGESYILTENFKIKNEENRLKLKFEGDEDLLHLIFVKNHLEELGVDCELILPYMPYSRMDRTEGAMLFTLKYVCRLINRLNFKSVTIYEPHSEVSTALLDRVRVVDMSKIITESVLKEIQQGEEAVYLVYPDAGAAKRYAKQIHYDKILTATKERDFLTGHIKTLEINGDCAHKQFKAIIVDDLCSMGGTFALTATKLKEMGASDVYLVVTHCENTVFKGELLTSGLISKIYTTDSILNQGHEKIIVHTL